MNEDNLRLVTFVTVAGFRKVPKRPRFEVSLATDAIDQYRIGQPKPFEPMHGVLAGLTSGEPNLSESGRDDLAA